MIESLSELVQVRNGLCHHEGTSSCSVDPQRLGYAVVREGRHYSFHKRYQEDFQEEAKAHEWRCWYRCKSWRRYSNFIES